MNNSIRTCVTAAVVAAAALPGAAFAGPGHHEGRFGGEASKRTELRAERVASSLEKAVDAIDDGDEAKAAAKLAAVDKNLGRALKAANRQADGEKGPGSLGLVAETADDVALTTADAMDGASQGLTDSLAGSLDGALTTRDAVLVTIGGLADPSGYEDVLDEIAASSDGEAEAFTEGAADDELTDSGESALTDAAARATATADAADLLAGADDADESAEEAEDEEGKDCPRPRGPGGHGGPGGPSGDSQESPRFRP